MLVPEVDVIVLLDLVVLLYSNLGLRLCDRFRVARFEAVVYLPFGDEPGRVFGVLYVVVEHLMERVARRDVFQASLVGLEFAKVLVNVRTEANLTVYVGFDESTEVAGYCCLCLSRLGRLDLVGNCEGGNHRRTDKQSYQDQG
jgi:hypothetical protein